MGNIVEEFLEKYGQTLNNYGTKRILEMFWDFVNEDVDGDLFDSFQHLMQHVGHNIACVSYTNAHTYSANVAIECEDCNEVLVDFDNPEAKNV